MLNLIEKFRFDLAVTVFSTSIDTIQIADQKITLGKDYINRFLEYEK